MLWQYGLSPVYLNRLSNDMTVKWEKVYNEEPWYSVEEFIQRYDYNMTDPNTNFKEYLLEYGLKAPFIDELVSGISRAIYNQNVTDLSPIAGLICIAGEATEIFGWTDTKVIFEKLAKAADIDNLRLNHLVTHVHLNIEVTEEQLSDEINQKENQPQIVTQSSSSTLYSIKSTNLLTGEKITEEYDAVIIATPIEFSKIHIDGFVQEANREYQKVYVTYIHGILNPSRFGLSDDVPLANVFTTVKNVAWNYMGVKEKLDDGSVIAKFFSTNPVAEDELNKIFKQIKEKKVFIWEDGAYPKLKPGLHIPPLILNRNLFYLSAFESFISVLEGSVVTSRNIIRILSKEIQNKQTTDPQQKSKEDL
jgi:hypothetical protein